MRSRSTRRHKRQRIVEGEDNAVDTVMVERTYVDTPTGSIQQKTFVPVRLDDNAHRATTETAAGRMEMDPTSGWDDVGADVWAAWNSGADSAAVDEAAEINDREAPHRQRHDQAFYMKEFASHVDRLLQSLLSKETLPNGRCGKCSERQSRWRCKECFLAQPLCRSCMRHTHMNQPFHRIERWTGTYFQSANLWQVGVYIRLGHTDSSPPCQYFQWQDNQLENFQKVKDEDDESYVIPSSQWQSHNNQETIDDAAANADAADIQFMNNMDQLYHHGKDVDKVPSAWHG